MSALRFYVSSRNFKTSEKFIVRRLLLATGNTFAKENIDLSTWLDTQGYFEEYTIDSNKYKSIDLNFIKNNHNKNTIYSKYKDHSLVTYMAFEKICNAYENEFVDAVIFSKDEPHYDKAIKPLLLTLTKSINKNRNEKIELPPQINSIKNKFGVPDIIQPDKTFGTNINITQIVYKFNHHDKPVAVNFYVNEYGCLYATAYYYEKI